MGAKLCFLKSYEESMDDTFLIFCAKLQQQKGLKLAKIIFNGKNLPLRFLDKKWPQIHNLSAITNPCTEFFLISCMMLQQLKRCKLGITLLFQNIFPQILVWGGFLGKKGSQLGGECGE